MSAETWRGGTGHLAVRLVRAFGCIESLLARPAWDLERRPAAGGWSAAEVAEHVALTNHHLLLLVEKIADRARTRAERGELPTEAVSPTGDLARIAERGFRWESPEHMVPRGSATPRELARTLRGQRRRCLAPLLAMREGEGALHAISMSVVGAKLDLYQFLTVIALHLERHAAQMERALGVRDRP